MGSGMDSMMSNMAGLTNTMNVGGMNMGGSGGGSGNMTMGGLDGQPRQHQQHGHVLRDDERPTAPGFVPLTVGWAWVCVCVCR